MSSKTHNRKPTRRKTPQAWRKSVDRIKDPVTRRHAACVIWWDHIAPARDKDPTAEDTLSFYVDSSFIHLSFTTEDKLEKALRRCGYTEEDAHSRSRDKGYHVKKPRRTGGYIRKTSKLENRDYGVRL